MTTTATAVAAAVKLLLLLPPPATSYSYFRFACLHVVFCTCGVILDPETRCLQPPEHSPKYPWCTDPAP